MVRMTLQTTALPPDSGPSGAARRAHVQDTCDRDRHRRKNAAADRGARLVCVAGFPHAMRNGRIWAAFWIWKGSRVSSFFKVDSSIKMRSLRRSAQGPGRGKPRGFGTSAAIGPREALTARHIEEPMAALPVHSRGGSICSHVGYSRKRTGSYRPPGSMIGPNNHLQLTEAPITLNFRSSTRPSNDLSRGDLLDSLKPRTRSIVGAAPSIGRLITVGGNMFRT
jgi:hypothetical protein